MMRMDGIMKLLYEPVKLKRSWMMIVKSTQDDEFKNWLDLYWMMNYLQVLVIK